MPKPLHLYRTGGKAFFKKIPLAAASALLFAAALVFTSCSDSNDSGGEPPGPPPASYVVKHYQAQADDSYPAAPTESETKYGTVGDPSVYTPKTGGAYTGFIYNSALTKINGTVQENGTIADDGSTVVELYYERNTVNVKFKLAGGSASGNADDIVKTGKYGTTLTAPSDPVQAGFAFKGWNPELPDPLVFPAADAEYTAQWAALYNIDFGVDGGTGGTLTAQAEGEEATTNSPIIVEYGKKVTFTAAPVDGYEVEKWTNGGTDIDEAGTNKTYGHTVTTAVDIKVKFKEIPAGTAVLTLSPDKPNIGIKVITSNGSSVTVEGCTETTLASGTKTILYAQGTTVKLTGKIIELSCSYNRLTALNVQGLSALQKLSCIGNQLTALNVQGLTALKGLWCYANQLDADAFKKIFENLPMRADGDKAMCLLYIEASSINEGNHTDFTAPPELKNAFLNTKNVKKWKMYKYDIYIKYVEI